MSAEQLTQSYSDAFSRHDLEAQIGTLSNDVTHGLNEGGDGTGRDAFRAFKIHMDECYREQIKNPVIMTNGKIARVTFCYNLSNWISTVSA